MKNYQAPCWTSDLPRKNIRPSLGPTGGRIGIRSTQNTLKNENRVVKTKFPPTLFSPTLLSLGSAKLAAHVPFYESCGSRGQSRTTSAEDCCFFRPKLSFVRGFKKRRPAFGGRGGHGRAALRRLRLLFITANSVARMRRLLKELNRGVRTVLPICAAQVLLFETCGSRA